MKIAFTCVLLIATAHAFVQQFSELDLELHSFDNALMKSGISPRGVFTLMTIPTAEHYAVIVSRISSTRSIVALLYQHTDGTVEYLHRRVLQSRRLSEKSLTLRVYSPKGSVATVCLAEYWYCEVHINDNRIVCEDL